MQPTHIKHLRPDLANRRKHNPRNMGMLVDALQQVGAARSIVIDEDNEVLAGNGVIEAAAEAGITKVQTVDADGETIIAVRRSGLTTAQKPYEAVEAIAQGTDGRPLIGIVATDGALRKEAMYRANMPRFLQARMGWPRRDDHLFAAIYWRYGHFARAVVERVTGRALTAWTVVPSRRAGAVMYWAALLVPRDTPEQAGRPAQSPVLSEEPQIA